jgi:hypothetical protein
MHIHPYIAVEASSEEDAVAVAKENLSFMLDDHRGVFDYGDIEYDSKDPATKPIPAGSPEYKKIIEECTSLELAELSSCLAYMRALGQFNSGRELLERRGERLRIKTKIGIGISGITNTGDDFEHVSDVMHCLWQARKAYAILNHIVSREYREQRPCTDGLLYDCRVQDETPLEEVTEGVYLVMADLHF